MSTHTPDGLSEVSTRLRAALASHPVEEDTLRAAITSFVETAKAQGWPVERVIIEVKRMAESPDGMANRWRDASDRIDGQRLLARAVSWSVERYYDGSAR